MSMTPNLAILNTQFVPTIFYTQAHFFMYAKLILIMIQRRLYQHYFYIFLVITDEIRKYVTRRSSGVLTDFLPQLIRVLDIHFKI